MTNLRIDKFFQVIILVFIIHGFGQYCFGSRLAIPNDTVGFYSPVAINLAEGRGYLVDGQFSNRYPPVYPLFLSLIYKVTGNATVTNPVYPYIIVFIQSLSCGMLYLLGASVFSSAVGVLAAILIASYPFFVVMSVTRYVWTAMPLFILMFLSGLYFFIRGANHEKLHWLGLSGFFTGLSCLVWPATIYAWIVFSGVIYFSRVKAKWLKMIILIIGFMAPVVMWSGYVYQKTGRFEVSNGSMLSIHDGLIRNDGHKLNRFEVSQDAKREHAQNKLNNLKDVALFYLKELQSKPADAIKFIFFKAFRPWYAADSELYEKRIALIQLPYLGFGFAADLSKRPPWLLLVYGTDFILLVHGVYGSIDIAVYDDSNGDFDDGCCCDCFR